MPDDKGQDKDAGISPALRVMLIEWRRTRITEANAIADLLGLGRTVVVKDNDKDIDT